jgi:BarA-like signal transduction histidine kinase
MMLLALPVQGMAQASMFACHLNGDTSDSVQMMDHSMHAMDSHDHTNTEDSRKLMKSLHGCCNCAPTCAVVLLPVAQASFDAVQHDMLHPVSAPQIPHSADTRRIDRPPKILAI